MPDPSLSSLCPEHVAAPPTWKPQVFHVLLAGLLCQHVAFFLFPERRGFLFGQGWPGTDWLLCGCTKGSLWEVSTGGAVRGEGTNVQGASE